MASVWLERKGKEPRKIGTRLHPVDAIKLYQHQLKLWTGKVCECPGHSFHAMLHHRNPVQETAIGPFAVIWIEFNSPPSKAEPGQPKHPKAKAAK